MPKKPQSILTPQERTVLRKAGQVLIAVAGRCVDAADAEFKQGMGEVAKVAGKFAKNGFGRGRNQGK